MLDNVPQQALTSEKEFFTAQQTINLVILIFI